MTRTGLTDYGWCQCYENSIFSPRDKNLLKISARLALVPNSPILIFKLKSLDCRYKIANRGYIELKKGYSIIKNIS